MSFGKNVSKLRKKNGLSQEQLGDKLNVSRQTISNWEIGETSPNLKQLKVLSEELGVSIDELLDHGYTTNTVKSASKPEEPLRRALTQQVTNNYADPSVREETNQEKLKSDPISSAQEVSTQQVASNHTDSSTEKESISKKPKTGNDSQKLNAWQITLLVLGFPLWFPLLIAIIVIVLSVYIILWAIVISLWAIFFAMLCISVYLLLTGNVTIFTHTAPAGLAIIGMSVFCAGLSILMFYTSKILTKATILATKKSTQWIHNNLSKKDTTNE